MTPPVCPDCGKPFSRKTIWLEAVAFLNNDGISHLQLEEEGELMDDPNPSWYCDHCNRWFEDDDALRGS